MEWLGLDGVQFGYRFLLPGKEVSFEYFYTCNLSVKREFLVKNGMFDENFQAAAFEDIELGYRLIIKGLRVLYNPEAIGYHYRRFSYADACRRQELVCAARVLFETTEAGRYLKDRVSGAKPIMLEHSLKRAMARVITPFLVVLTPLLDTHLRLPRMVYSLLYSRNIAPKAQASFERSRLRQEDEKGT
jgi:GT2 family glycosyltransferase